MGNFSMWIVEYARIKEFPVGGVLYGQHNAGHRVLPYCYAVLRSEEHTVLVDTGYNHADHGRVLAEQYGVTDWQGPEVVLARIGLAPSDVDIILLTHNHFDHAGNIDTFPQARVYLQAREITKYLEAQSLSDRFSFLQVACDPDDMIALIRRSNAGLLNLVEGEHEVLPGLTLRPAMDTHTLGSQYVTIENDADGRWVLPSDNVYVYENLEGCDGDGHYVPIGLVTGSVERSLFVMDEMYRWVGEDAHRVVPFHEANLWAHFPSRTYEDGLHIAEITLAPGEPSRIGDTSTG